MDYGEKYCIIGAGSSGIVAGKMMKQAGMPFDIIEREDEVGGNWYYGKPHSSVYKSTHLISSKAMTAYLDYPMPDDYPDYPSHVQILAYLRDYARHFGVYDHIEFNTSVENCERADSGEWDITLGNGETRRYKGLVIANGHNWDPKYPNVKGEFNGTTLHSADYKTPDVIRDKRVLVVGAGNSGCDIAVESAQNAEQTFHSTRRGYYYAPKYALGKPSDVVNEASLNLGVPVWLRRIINGLLLKILVGDLRNYGLRKPDHKFYETHPIVNQHITYYMGHGKITPKGDVSELCGDSVKFVDGTTEAIDVLIYATGFNITFPFIDSEKYLNWRDGRPDLYMHAFHREYDNLFVIGLIQPDSGQFWIADLQAQVMVGYLKAMAVGSPEAQAFKQTKATAYPELSGGVSYVDSTRHLLEIAHHVYKRIMKAHIKQLGRVVSMVQ